MASSDALRSWLAQQPKTGETGMIGERSIPEDESRRAEFDAEAMPHLNDLYRTATRILGDRNRAEDVVQEVFLQAWKSFHRFEKGTNCRAWLFKILFHCVNHHRRKWFRFPLLKETEEFLEANLVAPQPVPERLTDAAILAALDGIPADFRAVVLLVDVEEFAYKDAAEILSVPIGTVMSRLSRGRKLLRESLAEVAHSYGIGKTSQKEQSA
jgi:RNA polymerase sigma-70 factor (ECF subfamily)